MDDIEDHERRFMSRANRPAVEMAQTYQPPEDHLFALVLYKAIPAVMPPLDPADSPEGAKRLREEWLSQFGAKLLATYKTRAEASDAARSLAADDHDTDVRYFVYQLMQVSGAVREAKTLWQPRGT